VAGHIEDPDAYERGRTRAIRHNRWKGGRARFLRDYPELAKKLLAPWELPDYVEPTDDELAQKANNERWALIQKARIPDFIRQALDEWGGLTEKQAALAQDRFDNIEKLQAGWDEAEEARRARAPAWTEGRHEVEGVIKTVKRVERDVAFHYGDSMVDYKMLLELDDGRLLWCTLPRAISGNKDEIKKAKPRIRMRVAVQPKEDDPTFGYGKRPTKVEELT
jgi:hypothetical protein